MPKSRIQFWKDKFENNVKRDEIVANVLGKMGWKVMVIWECQTKDKKKLADTIEGLLN